MTGDPLHQKNIENRSRWLWRRHQQGGSMHVCGRDLPDLRNDTQLKWWRVIQWKVSRALRVKWRHDQLAWLARRRA